MQRPQREELLPGLETAPGSAAHTAGHLGARRAKKGDPDGLQGLQRTRGAMCSENQNPLENALSLEGGENVKASLNLKSKCQEECYISLHAWGASISFHSLSFHFLLVEGRQRHLPEPGGCREGV